MPLLLAACSGGGSSAPTPNRADEFLIVTATPGVPATLPPAGVGGERYVVREGDSLSVIADRFGTTEEALLRANGIDDPDTLFIGQELVIPADELSAISYQLSEVGL